LLPDPGIADLARLHGKYVSVDVAEGVANFIDNQSKPAVGAVAEIDRRG
jgi:hypothetical protein